MHRLPVAGEVWWHRFTGERGAVRVLSVVDDDGEVLVLFRYVLANGKRPAVSPLVDFYKAYHPGSAS
jgi:hypothetical protein